MHYWNVFKVSILYELGGKVFGPEKLSIRSFKVYRLGKYKVLTESIKLWSECIWSFPNRL